MASNEATNKACATVTNAMVIAGIEMLMNPDLNRYCKSAAEEAKRHVERRDFRIKTIRRVIQSELDKPSTKQGDPNYYLILTGFRDMPDHKFIDSLETLPYVGSRGNESPVWDMPTKQRPVPGTAKKPKIVW